MSLGKELDKQIYAEGEPSWGLKEGFLDVKDVKDLIKEFKQDIRDNSFDGKITERYVLYCLDSKVGDKLK